MYAIPSNFDVPPSKHIKWAMASSRPLKILWPSLMALLVKLANKRPLILTVFTSLVAYSGLKYLNLIHKQSVGRIFGALEVLPIHTVTLILFTTACNLLYKTIVCRNKSVLFKLSKAHFYFS